MNTFATSGVFGCEPPSFTPLTDRCGASLRSFSPCDAVPDGAERKEGGGGTRGETRLYLMLSLLQIPAGPQREPQPMADLCFVLASSQLLCKPQACQRGRGESGEEESEQGRVKKKIQSRQTLRYLPE